MLLLITHWKYGLIGVCFAVIIYMYITLNIRNHQIQKLEAKYDSYVIQQELVAKQRIIVNKTLELEYESNIRKAIENANQKIKVAANAATNTQLTIASLREQTNFTASQLSLFTDNAKTEYITTCNSVLNDLAEEGARIAEKADGHAIDAATLSEAWPVATDITQ